MPQAEEKEPTKRSARMRGSAVKHFMMQPPKMRFHEHGGSVVERGGQSEWKM